MKIEEHQVALQELLSFNSSRLTTDMVVDLVKKHPSLFSELIRISINANYPECMRAAWAMQHCCNDFPEWIYPYINLYSSNFLNSPYEGVKRNFLKILADHIDICTIPQPDYLISKAFDILSNPNEPVANRVYSMVIIYRYGNIEPDLLYELRSIIEMELCEAKAGFQSKGKKILKALSQKNRAPQY